MRVYGLDFVWYVIGIVIGESKVVERWGGMYV